MRLMEAINPVQQASKQVYNTPDANYTINITVAGQGDSHPENPNLNSLSSMPKVFGYLQEPQHNIFKDWSL